MALMFLVVIAFLTATASTVTTLARQISGNYKASVQSFQSAEAGAEEARARLRANAANPIYDNTVYDNAVLPQPPWQTYIGSATDAQVYGYTTGNTQTLVASLQTASHYTVKIEHATNAGGQMLYWGSLAGTGVNIRNTTLTGNPIYLVTSHGITAQANSIVQTQVARVPPVPIPGAVYVDDNTSLLGSSTFINGKDVCGTHNVPGITTPLGTTTNGYATITQNGNPDVQGKDAQGNSLPIQYNSTLLNVQAIVDGLKGAADSSYTYSATTTVSQQSWGTPTAGAHQTDALSCSVSHIVYFNMMYNTSTINSLKLSGGTQGCGILLVQGNLEINGDFSWYGPVLATGMVTYTGGAIKILRGR
jgi:Tfp pilus assembly protein PilX